MENNSNQITTKFEEKHILAVAIVFIVACCVSGGYVITYAIQPSEYHEMYLLDAQNQANNYPQTLIINQNSTFNTAMVVTNNMPKTQNYQIQIKIVHNTRNFPVDAPTYKTYEFTLEPKQTWNNQATISINEKGTYSVVFELYAKEGENYVFTDNFCVLHLEAITSTA